jgi:hypothetical protein
MIFDAPTSELSSEDWDIVSAAALGYHASEREIHIVFRKLLSPNQKKWLSDRFLDIRDLECGGYCGTDEAAVFEMFQTLNDSLGLHYFTSVV